MTLPAQPAERPPVKVSESPWRRLWSWQTLDLAFFAVALLCVMLLAIVMVRQGLRLAPQLAYLLVFWALMSYLALPRMHRILTAMYVPGYFIGRTQTTDGLLGDPVNLAVRGSAEQVHRVMQAAGWTLADPLSLRSSVGIVRAALLRRSYPNAPVSTLMLFGEPQSFAYQQEVAGNPSQRHHVRFWPTPAAWLLPGGQQVDWLAAGTYDRSVGLSLFTGQVTHKIDADIDIERDHILQTVHRAAPEVGCTVLENFATGYHSRNGGGDTVRTDGDLPIIELADADLSALPDAVLPDEGADAPDAHDGLVVATTKAAQRVGERPTALVGGTVAVLLGMLPDFMIYRPSLTDMIAEANALESTGQLEFVIWGTLVIGYGVLLALLVLCYRGQVWARFALLAMLCLQITAQLWQWVTLPTGSLQFPALLVTSMYVVGVFGLSSLSVGRWSVGHRRARRG